MHIALMVQLKNKHAVCLEASTDLGEQFCCTRALQMNVGRFYGNHTLRAKLIDLTRAFTVTKRKGHATLCCNSQSYLVGFKG